MLENEAYVDLNNIYVYLINEDLHMGIGKIASQVSHVAMQLGVDYCEGEPDNPYAVIGKSIILYASEKYMLKLLNEKRNELTIRYVVDAGLTEVPKHSLTCIGFRRYTDEYTKGLKSVK